MCVFVCVHADRVVCVHVCECVCAHRQGHVCVCAHASTASARAQPTSPNANHYSCYSVTDDDVVADHC